MTTNVIAPTDTTTTTPINMTTTNDAVLQRLVALRSMDVNALRALWLKLYGSKCPKHFTSKHLRPKLTYRIQELAYGGNTAETEARFADHARRYFKGGKYHKGNLALPAPGTVLTGKYKGVAHHALVLENGKFQYNGCIYKSLTAIVNHITDMSWNGWEFFGLKQ